MERNNVASPPLSYIPFKKEIILILQESYMPLRFRELQSVAAKAIEEERITQSLVKEVRRVLGPSAYVDGTLKEVAEAAIYRLDVLERTGRNLDANFNRGLMLRLSTSADPTVRRLAARTLPVNDIFSMAGDHHQGVRVEAAKRLPVKLVKEMAARYPGDDAVGNVLKARLHEAGLPQPKVNKEEFDIYGKKRLGSTKQQGVEEKLSDAYYKTLAKKIILDYSGNLENTWEEIAVHRYVASSKATSGVEIDEIKLYKEVKKMLRDREDAKLEKAKSSLKEIAQRLRTEDLNESLDIAASEVDPVEDLLNAGLSAADYVNKANVVFNVKESTLPPGIRKYKLAEGQAASQSVPCIGRLPHGLGFRSIDEKALDAYCTHWTARQALQGEPLRLEWSTHPDEVNKFSFNVVLR